MKSPLTPSLSPSLWPGGQAHWGEEKGEGAKIVRENCSDFYKNLKVNFTH